MTLKEAKETLRLFSITISKKDGEYRVNFNGGKEETAYYTNDIDDAVATGIKMSEQRRPHRALNTKHYAN